MWALANRTPYAAERNWTRGKDGEHLWVVAVKATFDAAGNGAVKLSDEQCKPVLVPEYTGAPGASSLRYDSDLLLVKPSTDILVNGRAYAPGGTPARSVPVTLRAADVEKSIVVHGDREYYDGVTGIVATTAQPFDTRAIVYEDAFGGADRADPDPSRHRIDARNPIGKGFAVTPRHLVHQLAPAIEYASGQPVDRGPAGFGAIDRAWSPRLELAGTYDANWVATKLPLLPVDFDARYALAAPRDQWPRSELRGGERVELTNMNASGLLRIDLPRITLRFTTRFGAREEEHDAKLVTVIVEPEASRLFMVWQTSLFVLGGDVDYLDETRIEELRP